MKSIQEVLSLSVEYLKGKKINSPRLTAESLLSHILGISRMDLYLRFECPLEEKELSLARDFLKRAGCSEPIDYILGSVEFFGASINVAPSVLIPRQETEILADEIATRFLKKDLLANKVLWDICSGSGCIGISLKKRFPDLTVVLGDISSDALALSKTSAEKNNVALHFVQSDLFAAFEGKKADYIVCNPPYISEKEYENLEFSVRGYEPKLALVGGVSGFEFYERLAKELPKHLASGGKVFLEIGWLQGERVKQIFSCPHWVKKELKQDWAGKDRFFFLEIE